MHRQLAEDYRTLGLRENAAFDEVKAAYRRLARRYHPDVNPGDRNAEDRFICITQAYQRLVSTLPVRPAPRPSTQPPITVTTPPTVEVLVNPDLSSEEHTLKQRAYRQLQTLFQTQRFPRAIALVDGLAQRLPQDTEVRQWRAITYQRWGRHLIRHGQYEKARHSLKKALRIDPHNKALWQEINRDFQRIEHLVWQQSPAVAP
ncbi:J domain-containing protein [Leptolyngbya sp. PCC 6406]|uniref:J domain-containing protein n=1 Tax=Leptolyngbya sp. PCC 6406 TaxID=1173264 RepID=UPI0002AC2884|nr:DnaJ domain-containing protein [Leptolyngbya sp. PCC 6406]